MDTPDQPNGGLSTQARILIAMAVTAAIFVGGYMTYEAAHNELGMLIVSISGLLGLAMLACIPLVLAWFTWHFVVRRLYRVRHIRQKEMERLIRESLARDPSSEIREPK